MGLFSFFRDLFGGTPPPAETPSHDGPEPYRAVNPRTGEKIEIERASRQRNGRLAPLKYRSSLVRTPPERELAGKVRPYAFAPRDPRTGQWLDFSRDSDPRWLEFYGLPELKTPQDLADWLEIPLGKLVWLTHRLNYAFRPENAQKAHYHFHWIAKRSYGHRLIEAPKPLLKEVQQKILRGILDHVPPHPNAHGFVQGRSILSNARPHLGKYVLLKFDLEDFYPSVRYPRVVAIFRSLGFSREVAIWLARLTTSSTPPDLASPERYLDWLYMARHLPQGAPTSPALANLSAYSLDVRLTGLARRYDITYTRYADDLTFSGSRKMGGALRDFIPLVQQIIKAERFRVNKRKRKVLRHYGRQSVTGVVVNAKPNLARDEYDRLKATLTNCVRHGPAGQNRQQHPDFAAHLRGRIGHLLFLNEHRGRKLLKIYEAIDWTR